MTWLNWSLKLHSKLRTIPHLIHTHNTQDFCSMNAYFIYVIVHVQMWCVYLIEISKMTYHKMKYQKFQASISKWDVKIKNDQMLWIVKKPNEKFQRYVIIFLWEVMYVHFYNWDRPLDLVPVVYDLIELIIETSL